MELRLDTYEQTHTEMEDEARCVHSSLADLTKILMILDSSRQRQQVQSLQARLVETHKHLAVRKRSQTLDFSQYHEHSQQLSDTNQRLREENDELKEEVVEMKAMVEMLKAQVTGNHSAFSPVRSSPLLPFRDIPG